MYKGCTFPLALGLTWDMEFVTTLPRNVMFGAKKEVLTGVVALR